MSRLSGAVAVVDGATDRVKGFVADLATTNARIVVSLVLATATGVRVLIVWTAPPWEWLAFLAAMMSLDVAQFGIKRHTHLPTPEEPPDAGTD